MAEAKYQTTDGLLGLAKCGGGTSRLFEPYGSFQVIRICRFLSLLQCLVSLSVYALVALYNQYWERHTIGQESSVLSLESRMPSLVLHKDLVSVPQATGLNCLSPLATPCQRNQDYVDQ